MTGWNWGNECIWHAGKILIVIKNKKEKKYHEKFECGSEKGSGQAG